VQRTKTGAVLLALAVMGLNALVFWIIAPPVYDSALSFWNRPFSQRFFLTAVYVCVSARILLWYHDRMRRYAEVRKYGRVRILPLAFGVAVFGCTLAWWLTVVVGVPTIELYGVLFKEQSVDWTLVLLPFSYFIQLLFLSRSTLIWLLCAGLSWPLVSSWAGTGGMLASFYGYPEGVRATPPLAWLKVWNVFGYLVFLLSLLFQSG
jgi:hypothetical protein